MSVKRRRKEKSLECWRALILSVDTSTTVFLGSFSLFLFALSHPNFQIFHFSFSLFPVAAVLPPPLCRFCRHWPCRHGAAVFSPPSLRRCRAAAALLPLPLSPLPRPSSFFLLCRGLTAAAVVDTVATAAAVIAATVVAAIVVAAARSLFVTAAAAAIVTAAAAAAAGATAWLPPLSSLRLQFHCRRHSRCAGAAAPAFAVPLLISPPLRLLSRRHCDLRSRHCSRHCRCP
jgi:hypothetical protein